MMVLEKEELFFRDGVECHRHFFYVVRLGVTPCVDAIHVFTRFKEVLDRWMPDRASELEDRVSALKEACQKAWNGR